MRETTTQIIGTEDAMKCIAVGMFMVVAAALSAQTTAQRTPEQLKASFDAHRADFDYLLGDWEFTGTNKQFGKFHGYWSATRLPEGSQIFDEYRVVGDSGETYYVT